MLHAVVELTCIEVVPNRVQLRPAARQRQWMDDTPNAFAYRCLPLTIANTHGWEMLCPFSFEAKWNGESGLDAVRISLPDTDLPPHLHNFVTSHFGSGILTFNPLVIMRTEPRYNLWVAGPANSFKDAIQPMTATIETDWMPYTFAVSWKFTRTDTVVRFERGEPFCAFFPTRRGVVAACEPRMATLSDDPELEKTYQWGLARRQLDPMMADAPKDQWQSWYTRAQLPTNKPAEVDDHEVTIKPKPFER